MQALRDNPDCAEQELQGAGEEEQPGLHSVLTFDLNELLPSPLGGEGAKLAIGNRSR